MNRIQLSFCTLLLAAMPLLGATASDNYWLHVKVDEKPNGAHIRVNLPLSAVEAALPLIPEEHFRDGRIHIDSEHEIDVAQLRQIWKEIRDVPLATTIVSVEDREESVLVTRRDDHFLIEVEDRSGQGENVEVKLPFEVVEALLSGDGAELDLIAGLRALASYGEGELVAVNGKREQVRVWIDSSPDSR